MVQTQGIGEVGRYINSIEPQGTDVVDVFLNRSSNELQLPVEPKPH